MRYHRFARKRGLISGVLWVLALLGTSASLAIAQKIESKLVAMLYLESFVSMDEDETLLPRVAIYADGTVLHLLQEQPGDWELHYARLSVSEIEALKHTLMDAKEFFELRDEYNLDPCMLDGPGVRVFLAGQGQSKWIRVRGYSWRVELPSSHWGGCSGEVKPIPVQIERIIHVLTNVKYPDGKRWSAPAYRVWLARWELFAPEVGEPIGWPVDWPKPTRPNAGQGFQGPYELVLGGDKGQRLAEMHDAHRQMRPILIDGEWYSMDYEPVIPGAPRRGEDF
jgi:hypothetical protein